MNEQELTEEVLTADENFDASENISDNILISPIMSAKSKRRRLEELLEERDLRRQLEDFDNTIDQRYQEDAR